MRYCWLVLGIGFLTLGVAFLYVGSHNPPGLRIEGGVRFFNLHAEKFLPEPSDYSEVEAMKGDPDVVVVREEDGGYRYKVLSYHGDPHLRPTVIEDGRVAYRFDPNASLAETDQDEGWPSSPPLVSHLTVMGAVSALAGVLLLRRSALVFTHASGQPHSEDHTD